MYKYVYGIHNTHINTRAQIHIHIVHTYTSSYINMHTHIQRHTYTNIYIAHIQHTNTKYTYTIY